MMRAFGCSRFRLVCAGLPQHHLRRVLYVGNDQKTLRCGRVWIIACEHLQRSDRLNDAPSIEICFQDRERLKLAERRVIGFRQNTSYGVSGASPFAAI
jgi:hypothetical protein